MYRVRPPRRLPARALGHAMFPVRVPSFSGSRLVPSSAPLVPMAPRFAGRAGMGFALIGHTDLWLRI